MTLPRRLQHSSHNHFDDSGGVLIGRVPSRAKRSNWPATCPCSAIPDICWPSTIPSAERREEIVLHALGIDADQDHAVGNGLARHHTGQQAGKRVGAQRGGRLLEIQEKLVPPGIRIAVAAIVRFEGPDRRFAQPDGLRIDRIRLEGNPVRGQVERGQAQGEGSKDLLAVIQEQQAPADNAAGVDNDIPEGGLPGILDCGQGRNGLVANGHDPDNPGIVDEQAGQLRAPRGNRDVAVDVQPDSPWMPIKKDLERLRQDGVSQRPLANGLDILFRNFNERDALILSRWLWHQADEPVVGRQFEKFQVAAAAQTGNQPKSQKPPNKHDNEGLPYESSIQAHAGPNEITTSC